MPASPVVYEPLRSVVAPEAFSVIASSTTDPSGAVAPAVERPEITTLRGSEKL